MKRNLLFRACLVALLFGTHLNIKAQRQVGIGIRDPAQKVQIDKCNIRVKYQFRYAMDTLGSPPKIDHQYLEIGDSISRCYSVFGDYIDSLFYKARIAGEETVSPRGWMRSDDWAERYEDTYMNFPDKGTLTTSIPITKIEYSYEEPIPALIWQLFPDALPQEILGYNCRKTGVRFRGRDYEVWYTEEISVSKGPWKFHGLPGLVLKVEEKTGLFAWTALEIVQPEDVYIHTYIPQSDKSSASKMKILKTSRKNVRKLQRMIWENYVEL